VQNLSVAQWLKFGDGGKRAAHFMLILGHDELCTGATVRVPTERAMSATSGTRAIGSPPLV